VSRKKNITDHAFRKSLGQYSEAPPEGVWLGISESLEKDRRKSRMAWIGRVAASAALVIAAGSIWFITQRTPEVEIGRQEVMEPVSEQEAIETDTEQEAIEPDTEQKTAEPVTRQEVMVLATEQEARQGLSEEQEVFAGGRGQEYGIQVSAPDGVSAMELQSQDRISEYTIPVNGPEPELIFAEHRVPAESISDEQGIDVFEEFGDEGFSDYDKWAVGGQVAPIYSYRNLGPSQSDALYANSYLNDIESGVVSYAGGVNLNYSPARRLSIQSGLNYYRMGMSVQNTYLASNNEKIFGLGFRAAELAMSNSSGDIQLGQQKSNTFLSNFSSNQDAVSNMPENYASGEVPDIQQGNLQQNFEYLELPLILRYRVVDRRAGLNVLGGLSTNFLVGSNVYFQGDGNRENIGTTTNLKSVNYSSVLGLGFQYSIKPSLHFNLEPTFRYYLNSINSGSGPGSHPYSIGFFTGISYSF
jgi:hypothetical protein